MRLVKTRAKTLSPEKANQLIDIVKTAEKRDKPFFDKCENLRAWLKGDQWPDNHSMRLTANLAHAHVRATVPTLFFKEPTVRAFPDNPEHEKSAAAWEDLLNAYTARTRYAAYTKEVVQDAVVYPEGWKKWVVHKVAEPDVLLGESDLPDRDESYGGLVEMDSEGPQIWNDKYTIVGQRLPPQCVITDCPERKLENSRFVAVKYTKLLSELEVDPRYSKGRAAVKNLIASKVAKNYTTAAKLGVDPDEGSSLAAYDQEVTIYEVWIHQIVDLKLYKQVVTITEEGDVLRGPTGWKEFLGPYMHMYPFTKLEINTIPDDKPQSELETWYDLQKSLNWVLSKIIGQVNNQKQIYNYYPQNAKNPTEAKKQLESGALAVYLEAKDVGVPVVEPVPHNRSSSDDWNLVQLLQALIQQVSGLGQNRRGSAGIRTATEASIIEQSTEIRTQEKIDSVEKFIREDLGILIRLLRGFVNSDFVFRLTGNIGPVKWGQFTSFDASWSPELRVEPESFRQAVDNQRLAAYAQAMQFAQGLFPVYGQRIRLDIILRRMLEEMNIPNPQEITNDDVPSEVKQMAELLQIVAGMGAEVLPTDDHASERQTIDAFRQSQVYQLLPPQTQMEIEQHYELHGQMLQQLQQQVTPTRTDSNSFSEVERNGNPASEARQETQGDRTPLSGGNF